jgi:hypothetical protein
MKKILQVTLGIVTSVGGFLEIGSVLTAAQGGAAFAYQLLWAILLGTVCLIFLVRPIARALHGGRFYSLYQVPWQDMDLSDPQHPGLRIAKRDLRHAV